MKSKLLYLSYAFLSVGLILLPVAFMLKGFNGFNFLPF